jgi:hypothetical protein
LGLFFFELESQKISEKMRKLPKIKIANAFRFAKKIGFKSQLSLKSSKLAQINGAIFRQIITPFGYFLRGAG